MISFCWRIVWNCSEEIYCTKECLGTIMKKRVAIINDDLGTMALGFSKAGYDVSAICVAQADKNSIRVLQENWGDVVRVTDLDAFNYQEAVTDLDVDFVAGRIAFGFSVAGKRWETMTFNVFEMGTEEAVYNAFQVLSDGGVIIDPIHELPWSKCCATIIDKFGVCWWISI